MQNENQKHFLCTCVAPDGEIITKDNIFDLVYHKRQEITKQKFDRNCYIPKVQVQLRELKEDSISFYRYKDIYWFVHSAIEYFFV